MKPRYLDKRTRESKRHLQLGESAEPIIRCINILCNDEWIMGREPTAVYLPVIHKDSLNAYFSRDIEHISDLNAECPEIDAFESEFGLLRIIYHKKSAIILK